MKMRVVGLIAVCWLLCGRFTSIAEGKTNVEVTMKKMSSKKMTSVIDAMLNIDRVLCCLFSAIVNQG
jgi:hypothetical protein